MFWTDGLARLNYALYHDVVSFDTTYDTNRYKMIFAPFTRLDNPLIVRDIWCCIFRR